MLHNRFRICSIYFNNLYCNTLLVGLIQNINISTMSMRNVMDINPREYEIIRDHMMWADVNNSTGKETITVTHSAEIYNINHIMQIMISCKYLIMLLKWNEASRTTECVQYSFSNVPLQFILRLYVFVLIENRVNL